MEKFNLSNFICFCKNSDHIWIIKEREVARRMRKDMGDDGYNTVKDVLEILLDIAEDESLEIRLTRENVKVFILVMSL